MMQPLYIQELARRESFTGVGPHSVATNLPAPSALRAATTVAIIIEDSTTTDYYYVARAAVVKNSATNITLANLVIAFAEPGWDGGNVTIGVSIVDDEVVGSVTMPDGPTVNIVFRVDGVLTT